MGLLKKRSSHCFTTFSVGGDGLRAVFTINSVKRLLGRGSSKILKNDLNLIRNVCGLSRTWLLIGLWFV